MSRAELVDAVNQHIWAATGTESALTETAYAKYERGEVRWPSSKYRDALRRVLGCHSDAAMGFAPTPRGRSASVAAPVTSSRENFTDAEDDPVNRRDFLRAVALGTGTATTGMLPGDASTPHAHSAFDGASQQYGMSDVARVRAVISGFSRADQRHGGGYGLDAVTRLFTGEVVGMLKGRYVNAATRQAMFSAASELSYLIGWMSFDDGRHNAAHRYFSMSAELADEACDPAMAGHTLRAMAHQAVELGRIREAVDLAEGSVNKNRYEAACPRERSLLGVVHARTLAAAGLGGGASAALTRAEDDLRRADPGDDEPGRVYFFSEASLAHETGRTLFAAGDVSGAVSALAHSAGVRAKQPFARTHAVTLGYLGEAQAAGGNLERACATWSAALDAMDGVRSARARQTILTMRSIVEPVRSADPALSELDDRAATYLARA